VGKPAKVHEDVKEICFPSEWESTDAVGAFMDSKWCFASTLLGVGDEMLMGMEFDVCVVDEASQASECSIIGALYRCKKFILVGDDKQLPPLVVSPLAAQHGMAKSLFERLRVAHPNSVAELALQYRMNEDITSVPNKLFYDGKLACWRNLKF